jgi:hypothetical protein
VAGNGGVVGTEEGDVEQWRGGAREKKKWRRVSFAGPRTNG